MFRDMFRVQRRGCVICFVFRGESFVLCDMVSCSEERVCDMFRVQRRYVSVCVYVSCSEEWVFDMRVCVICFVFRGEGV